MRTLVDLPQGDIELLNQLSKAGKISRAELVRQAVAKFLAPHRVDPVDAAFGLWANRHETIEDGLAYQERLRAEWDR